MITRALQLLLAVVAACGPAAPPATPPRAASAPTLAQLSDAVLPYSYEIENAETVQPPFVARFERADETMFFVASMHGCDPATFRLIDSVLATHRVRFVIVEGYPAGQGIDPPGFRRHFPEWQEHGFCHGGGEGGYAAFHAAEQGASFTGGEPDEKDVVRAVLGRGFTVEDLLGFYFVRQVPTLRREGTLAAKGLDESFRWLIDWMSDRAGLHEAGARFTLDRFRDWYEKGQGKSFDAATLDNEEPAPIAGGKLLTQRISAIVGLVRDRFTVDLIVRQLSTHKGVLVVYGGSHYPTQRPAFELLLGKPVQVKGGD